MLQALIPSLFVFQKFREFFAPESVKICKQTEINLKEIISILFPDITAMNIEIGVRK